MADDRDIYLNKEDLAEKHRLIRNHIEESRGTYLSQCQHAENLVHEALGSVPSMCHLGLQHVDLVRQRHNELYEFFDRFFLPTLQRYAETLSDLDAAADARLRRISGSDADIP